MKEVYIMKKNALYKIEIENNNGEVVECPGAHERVNNDFGEEPTKDHPGAAVDGEP